jgi:hypothetical protein
MNPIYAVGLTLGVVIILGYLGLHDAITRVSSQVQALRLELSELRRERP